MKDRTFHQRTRFVCFVGLCVTVFICFSTSNAQVYVERRKSPDPVTRTFDAAKNETIVAVIPEFFATLAGSLLTNSEGMSPSSTKVEFHLRVVSYSYPGNVPA